MDPHPPRPGPAVPPIPHIEVPDPAAAFRKLEAAGKKLMAAPKEKAHPVPPDSGKKT